MTYDILWHLMTIVAWSAFCFARKAVFASKALSVSTKNLAGKVRIEMKQHENVSQLTVVRVSSCFGTESPTYDKGASKQLAQQSKHLVQPPLYARSHNIPCQIICHVTAVWPCDTTWDLWQSVAKTTVNLSPASAADPFSWRCFGWTAANLSVSTQPHAWRNHSTLPTSPAQPWRFSVQVAETEAFEESTVPPGK